MPSDHVQVPIHWWAGRLFHASMARSLVTRAALAGLGYTQKRLGGLLVVEYVDTVSGPRDKVAAFLRSAEPMFGHKEDPHAE